MKELSGKTVFITGAAEGIGFHVGRALAGEGMRLMLADIDTKQLDKAIQTLKGEGVEVEGAGCDVALRSDLEAAAEKTVQTFGKVHMVINNEGVSVIGTQQCISEALTSPLCVRPLSNPESMTVRATASKVVDGRCEELKKEFTDASNSPHLKGVEKTGGFMG